jgi:hypothetical protein
MWRVIVVVELFIFYPVTLQNINGNFIISARQVNDSTETFSYDEAEHFGKFALSRLKFIVINCVQYVCIIPTQGPSNWKLLNAACGGNQQSPINIEISSVVRGTAPPLFINYFSKSVEAINVRRRCTLHSYNYD